MMNSATSDMFFHFNIYVGAFFQFQMEKNINNYFCEQIIETKFNLTIESFFFNFAFYVC